MCIHGDWLNEWIVIFPFSKPFGWVYAICFFFFVALKLIRIHTHITDTQSYCTSACCQCTTYPNHLSVIDFYAIVCVCAATILPLFCVLIEGKKNGDFGFHLVREIFWATIKVNKSIVLSRVCDWKRRRTSQFCIHRNSDRQQYRCLDNEWAMNCNGAAGEHKPTEFSFFIDCLTIESCISHREKERHPTAWTL